MDSYIVRVYRQGTGGLNEVAGLVEPVGSNQRMAFQSFSGLVAAIKQALGDNDGAVGEETVSHFHNNVSLLKKEAG